MTPRRSLISVFLIGALTATVAAAQPPKARSAGARPIPPSSECNAHAGFTNRTFLVRYGITTEWADTGSVLGVHDRARMAQQLHAALGEAAKRSTSGLQFVDVAPLEPGGQIKATGQMPELTISVAGHGGGVATTAFVAVSGLGVDGRLFGFWTDSNRSYQGPYDAALYADLGAKLEGYLHNGWNCP